MHLVNDLIHSLVAVCVHGIYFLVTLHKHVVNAPGVYRKALDILIFVKAKLDTGLYFLEKTLSVPHKMTVKVIHAVVKSVDFIGFNSVFRSVTDNVSAA